MRPVPGRSTDPNLRLIGSFLDYLKIEKGLAQIEAGQVLTPTKLSENGGGDTEPRYSTTRLL